MKIGNVMSMPAGDSQPASAEAMNPVASQLPWNSVPKFIPGTTNVQEYVQKLKFLAAMWPTEFLSQLAPRAALLVEGTAFKKVARLDPAKLRVNDQSGVALLVDAIGGSWGSTDFEEKYEYFERALYGTTQRSDESHDSYLARMEANFVELVNRGTKLEEVQAYVLLRQSLLPPEDKKRILVEHDGDLKYAPVVKSFRLLGSKFFNDLQGGRANNKTKVYDIHFTESFDGDGTRPSDDLGAERAFMTQVDEYEDLDPETFDAFLASEDQDALIVSSFEQELEDFLLDVPEMHEAMVSYLEARGRLLEKRKSRGFWPVRSKGSGSSKGFKGKGKGKKQRENLLARIAKSYCKKCGLKGHWKAECPSNRSGVSGSNDDNPAASANVVQIQDSHGPDVFEVQEVHSESEQSESVEVSWSLPNNAFSYHADVFVSQVFPRNKPIDDFQNSMHRIFRFCKSRPQSMNRPPRFQVPQTWKSAEKYQSDGVPSAFSKPIYEVPAVCHVAESTKVCQAILDTGASRCVIGEKVWDQLICQFPEKLKHQVRKLDSQVRFRFGNNQSLTSICKMQVPLANQQTGRRLWLSIEVVPGSTPFLFSKRAFKQLGGILDTTRDSCTLQRLGKTLQLESSKTELYLIDLMQLCLPTTRFTHKQHQASCHIGEFDLPGVRQDRLGKHDNPKFDETVSLSVADSAPNLCAPCFADPPLGSPVITDAFQSHVVSSENCLRSRHWNFDPSVASNRTAFGRNAHIARNRCRESSRDAPDHGRPGDRIAEPTHHADELAIASHGRTKSNEGEPTVRGSSSCSLWNALNNKQPSNTSGSVLEPRSDIIKNDTNDSGFHFRSRSSFPRRSIIKNMGVCGRRGRTGVRSGWKTYDLGSPPRPPAAHAGRSLPAPVSLPPSANPTTPVNHPPSLNEWGRTQITWGRKHKGRTFIQVLRDDPGYFTWSRARFASLPPPQQDFVRFCQVQMDVDQQQNP